MGALVDTHCHLYFNSFEADIEEVLTRAKDAGITKIVVPGIDIQTSQKAIDLAEKYSQIFATVGVHPTSTKGWQAGMVDELRTLAKHPKVIAIGEIGLDYYHDDSPRQDQTSALIDQLSLAGDLHLPVVLHSREALDDLWRIILVHRRDLPEIGGVFHAYEGGEKTALEIFDHGFMIGIGGPITFRNARDRQSIIAQVPLDAMVIETDAPFLAPHPHRGQRNEPAWVALVSNKIAELQRCDDDKVREVTTRNADGIFRWEQ